MGLFVIDLDHEYMYIINIITLFQTSIRNLRNEKENVYISLLKLSGHIIGTHVKGTGLQYPDMAFTPEIYATAKTSHIQCEERGAIF